MSCSVAYRLVLSHFSELSGKGIESRSAIYTLYVFPNVTL